jgi:hypothetical protein
MTKNTKKKKRKFSNIKATSLPLWAVDVDEGRAFLTV